MKIQFAMMLLAAVAGGCSHQPLFAQEAADPKAPFTLQITGNLVPGHSQYWDFANVGQTVRTSADGVVIAVQKTNVSDHEIPKVTRWGNFFVGCEYEVRDSVGNPVQRLPPRPVGGGPAAYIQGQKEAVLQPGESDVSQANLDELYDLSHPGTYTIQAWARAWDDPHAPIVKSNTLTLIIEPASAPPSQ